MQGKKVDTVLIIKNMQKKNFHKKGEGALKEYRNKVENVWSTRNIESVEEMVLSMVEAADKTLKKRSVRE